MNQWIPRGFVGLLFGVGLVLTSGCSRPESETAKSDYSAEESRVLAEALLDYESLIYNGFVDGSYEGPESDWEEGDALRPLKIGISWVKNDQFVPWIVGKEMGYFEAEGIDLQIVEGGPGRDNLVSLVGRKIDLFLGAIEPVLYLVTSPTGSDVVMFGATMKRSSAGWVMLDTSIPQHERSTLAITAADLRGKRVGVQGGGGFYVQFVLDRLGLKEDEVKLMTAGATPDALISGAMDFYQCWLVNQPRILERAGYMNWVGVTFDQLGYQSYNDATVVNRDFFEQEKPLLAAYMRGLQRAMDYLMEESEAAAKITAAVIDPAYNLSAADVKWRMEREVPIYKGDGSEPLLYMDPAKVEALAALLIEYGQIEIKP
ncbi:MAG: ABC transporter substrate-binding protein [Verrucomicrobiota bacterium]